MNKIVRSMVVLSIFAACIVRAESPRLTYAIETVNFAESVAVAPGGANGTEHAVRLTHRMGDWARFNWPLFVPNPDAREARFWVRRDGDLPKSCTIRVVTDDGVEWQSRTIDVGPEWREMVLKPDAFRVFRGGGAGTSTALSFGRAVQMQIVPLSSGQGKGTLWVDEIALLPGGPGFTADGDDVRMPLPPDERIRQRLADLSGRWRHELARIESRRAEAAVWLDQIEELRHLWNAGNTEAIAARFAARSCIWQNQHLYRPEAGTIPTSDAFYNDPAAWNRTLDSLRRRQTAVPLVSPGSGAPAGVSRLYSAPGQDGPDVVTTDGEPRLRARIRFTDSTSQQVVFVKLPLREPTDISGQVVVAPLRCTATRLAESEPVLLRVRSKIADGAESWADFRPEPDPGAAPGEVRFDVSRPSRSVRFDPTRATELSIRVENHPGAAQDFILEIGPARAIEPDPARRIFVEETGRCLADVHRARLALYELRDRIARAEQASHLGEGLRNHYLASFMAAGPPASSPGDPVPVLTGAPVPDRPMRPHAIVTRSEWLGGRMKLRVSGQASGGVELRVEVRDEQGRLASSGTGPAEGVELNPPGLYSWTTASPHRGVLRALLLDASGNPVAFDERPVAVRSVNLAAGGANAMLRHVSRAGEPDCGFSWNGSPWFPRMTRYSLSEGAVVLPAVRGLLDDLWMDGLREYGFKKDRAVFEAHDRLGIANLTAVAPGFKSLRDWDDIDAMRREMDAAYTMLRADADRPHKVCVQVGNEVELSVWGADLESAFPDALYHPLDVAAQAAVEILNPTAPVMYVRAGSFTKVPPLPHEDICGVNQYTGRYGGRIEEIARNLSELARQAMVCDRPVLIAEWMGPKYTWAATGIGGVTPRGAAYYLERYWRALVDTPGIAGSSEFTLNWVIAPFEDLTNQTREEAWKNRPPHHAFGGGRTADHVPLVKPEDAVRGPAYRSMQAIQSPLYLMVNRPGPIRILQSEAVAAAGRRVADRLRIPGKTVDVAGWSDLPNLADAKGHVLLLAHPSSPCTPLKAAIEAGWVEPPVAGAAGPTFRTFVNPARPDCLVTVMQAEDGAAAEAGIRRLESTADALVELNAQEGAMSRVVALVDDGLARYYESYLLEFAARGYIFGGEDTVTKLDPARFHDEAGVRRPAWADLSAVILEVTRELSAAELALIDRLVGEGVHLVISRPCYLANSGLRERFPAVLKSGATLADRLIPADFIRAPIPVHDMGGVNLEAIRRFGFPDGPGAALDAWTIEAEGAEPVATTEAGRAVAVRWTRGTARIVLLGVGIGEAGRVHWTVGRAGVTHSLYDRDTACGLERLARVVINACRADWPGSRPRPRLIACTAPAATMVRAGEPVRVGVMLTDVDGRAVTGQVRARVRTLVDGRVVDQGDWVDMDAVSPGRFELLCRPDADAPLAYKADLPAAAIGMVSIQIKAWAPGHIPADEAVAIVLCPQ